MANRILDDGQLQRGDSLLVEGPQGQDGWIARTGFLASFRASGLALFETSDTTRQGEATRLQFDGLELGIAYGEPFRDGFLGPRMVQRTARAAVSLRMLRLRTGEVLGAGRYEGSSQDTVAVDEIPSLESAAAACTKATVPPDNLLERVIEPFIIIGATGVAVYLFFHVRT